MECVSEYIFNFKKQTKKQKQKKKKREYFRKIDFKKNLRPPGWRFFSSLAFPQTRVLFYFYFFSGLILGVFFICKRDSNTFSRNLDFCVFGESTNFKISDVIIDLTALLKLHSQPTFFCSKSTTETLKKVYFQNQQEKDYVTDVVLVFF